LIDMMDEAVLRAAKAIARNAVVGMKMSLRYWSLSSSYKLKGVYPFMILRIV